MSRRRPPVALAALALICALFLFAPFLALVARAPWRGLLEELGRPEIRQALALSLRTSLMATVLTLVFGVPLAWVLARCEFPGRAFVRALALLPLVLPPVVGGVALLLVLGRLGVVGSLLES
ncbi:MAG: molybdate ABC transporter permease subunit, partial [Actinomycetota bacterium]|nr:molybdate ABC transporter permease subunit [Actinomycetota bacterium]